MKNRWLLRALAVFCLSFVTLAGLWSILAPFYNALIFSASNLVLQWDDPVIAQIGVDQGVWRAYHINGTSRQPVFEFDAYGTFFNMVLLLGLMLTAPGMTWTSRLLRSGLAVGALAIAHTLFVAIQVKAQFINTGWWVTGDQTAYLYNWLAVLLGTLGEQLLPLLIVGVLTWGAWMGQLQRQRAQAQRRHTTPCPCGSGKKFKHCCAKQAKFKLTLPEIRNKPSV